MSATDEGKGTGPGKVKVGEVTIHARIPADLMEAVDKHAKRHLMKRSQVVRSAVNEFVTKV